MRLCAHLLPFYRRAFPKNRILSIGLAYHTGWRMSVFFRDALPDALQNVPPDGEVQITQSRDYHFPQTKELLCHKCKMSLCFPLTQGQKENYWPAPWDRPDPRVVCTPDGVFVDEQILTEGQILTIPVTAAAMPPDGQ